MQAGVKTQGDSAMLAGDMGKHSINFSEATAPAVLSHQKVVVGNKGRNTHTVGTKLSSTDLDLPG